MVIKSTNFTYSDVHLPPPHSEFTSEGQLDLSLTKHINNPLAYQHSIPIGLECSNQLGCVRSTPGLHQAVSPAAMSFRHLRANVPKQLNAQIVLSSHSLQRVLYIARSCAENLRACTFAVNAHKNQETHPHTYIEKWWK